VPASHIFKTAYHGYVGKINKVHMYSVEKLAGLHCNDHIEKSSYIVLPLKGAVYINNCMQGKFSSLYWLNGEYHL
jgi:hypothetical protein